MRLSCIAAAVLALIALAGCSAGSNAIVESVRAIWSLNNASQAALNPNYRYIRVVAHGRVAMLALGDVEGSRENPVEVWYSAQKEVLRFQDGRLVGAVGLTTEWRKVELPTLPAWEKLFGINEFRWTRYRDVMPGYKIGVHDELLLRRIDSPSGAQLQGIPASGLAWFEESVVASSTLEKLQAARYALDIRGGRAVVVYGEQCLDAGLCFSWQRWPSNQGI